MSPRRRLQWINLHIAFVAFLGAIWILLATPAVAQSNEWAWMSGDRAVAETGVYGTKGVASPNSRPGARFGNSLWIDKSGNLWLFGGDGRDAGGIKGYLNDLWNYQPSTSQWTWVSGASEIPAPFSAPGSYGTLGVPAASNQPPGRSNAASWTDASGNLWLFGGNYLDPAGQGDLGLNDLWEFNTSTSMWVWMAGPNTPGQAGVYGTRGTASRANIPPPCSDSDYWMNPYWTDSQGRFWLFGCNGNDLWMFNPATVEWTWVSGSNTGNPTGVYGSLKQFSSSNVVPARHQSLGWSDKSGNVWIFGGANQVSFGQAPLIFNDLWEYQPGIDQWAWMGGSNTPTAQGYAGNYDSFQVASPANAPGSRYGGVSWADTAGDLWLYGGHGDDATESLGILDDLWRFSPGIGQWTWMGGDTQVRTSCAQSFNGDCGESGLYGLLGVPGLASRPGGRISTKGVADTSGNFWLFAGLGFDEFGELGYLNDLWNFQTNSNSTHVAATPVLTPGAGTYSNWVTLTMTDATAGASIGYIVNGQPPAIPYTGPVTLQSSATLTAIASSTGYANSNEVSAAYVLNLPVAATPVFSVASGNYSTIQTVAITSSTAGAAIYYTTDGSQPGMTSAVYAGPLSVARPETVRAIAIAADYVASAVASATYNVTSFQAVPQWTWVSGNREALGWYGTLQTSSATNMPSRRTDGATWTDKNGILWLFGGNGVDAVGTQGFLNDLWKFDPTTAKWTWMGGSDTIPACSMLPGFCGRPGVYGNLHSGSAANIPGARWLAVHWTDPSGNFWLFGGYGIDAQGVYGLLNDLWMFNPATLQWTWMSGSSAVPGLYEGAAGIYGVSGVPAAGNTPGGRRYATGWIDSSGNLFLYGGSGIDSLGLTCDLEDLWKFDVLLEQWSWVRGEKQCTATAHENGYLPVYGTQGVPWIETYPGSRDQAVAWTDNHGTVWLFAGSNTDPFGVHRLSNDLWTYDPTANIWTWVSTDGQGDSGNGGSVQGTLGVPSPASVPGTRIGLFSSWIDLDGNFWFLGGNSAAPLTCPAAGGNLNYGGFLDDLWKFSPVIHEWTWMGGLGCPDKPSTTGTLGSPAPANAPGSNAPSATDWTDRAGNLWLLDRDNGLMWQLGLANPPAASAPGQASAPVFSLAAGTYAQAQTLTISDSTTGAAIYYTTDGTPPSSRSPVYSSPISVSATETVTAIAISANCTRSIPTFAAYTITTPQAATPVITPAGATFTGAQNITITDTTPGASIYYTTNGTMPTTGSALYSGQVPVGKSETIEAIATAPGYSVSPVATAQFTVNPAPVFSIKGDSLIVSRGATAGNTTTITVAPAGGFTGSVSLAATVTAGPAGAVDSPILSFGTTSPVFVGAKGGTATLTVKTTAGKSAVLLVPNRPGANLLAGGGTVLAGVLLILCPRRWRKWPSMLSFALLLLAFMTGVTACGGGGSQSNSGGGGTGDPGTTPGTYTITVTGTSGALYENGTLTVTVN